MSVVIEEKDMHPEFGPVPSSKGIPRSVQLIAIFGIIGIFMVGASVVLNAGFAHQWPSAQTTRTPLGSLNV